VKKQNPNQPEHNETVVPVRSGIKENFIAPTLLDSEDRNYSFKLVVSALVVLASLALGVIFLLPGWVAEQVPTTEMVEQSVPPSESNSGVLAISPEELSVLRDKAEVLLAELLQQQGLLEAQGAANWAGEDWDLYQTLFRDGDDAFLADAFYDAVPSYQTALDLGISLLVRSENIIDRALETGNEALAAGNPSLAAEQFQLVLRIEADHVDGQSGLERAQILPNVLAHMEQGAERDQNGDLVGALEFYRNAATLDSLWIPARLAVASATRRIADARFDSLVSMALNALAEEEFEEAHQFFTDALKMRPDSLEALDGLAQADQGMRLEQIALAQVRATAFEKRELWDRAIQQYLLALNSDDSLEFAKTGLPRARARTDLDAKFEGLFRNPDVLFTDQILKDASVLLENARGINGRGPRLNGQIAELDRLVRLASTPIDVELRSDGLTNVTLYRVGSLGSFMTHHVQIRPGPYTALGSRAGYRDVRVVFEVLPGNTLSPIEIFCVERIN